MKILNKAKERTAADRKLLRDTVTGIIDRVCLEGDAALKEFNERFDGCRRELLRVSREEIEAARAKLTEQELAAEAASLPKYASQVPMTSGRGWEPPQLPKLLTKNVTIPLSYHS